MVELLMVLLGMLWVSDPCTLLHSTLSMYSTTANLTIAYNIGAIGGMMYALQVSSGIAMCTVAEPT